MSANWYESFFRGVVNDIWWGMIPPEWTQAETDFIEKALELRPGAKVLDVPCGNGRHALALAARGYRLSGTDVSEEAIAEARRLADRAGLRLELSQGDMRMLAWEGEFDGAFCFGNSFGYLDPEGMGSSWHRAIGGGLGPLQALTLRSRQSWRARLLPSRTWAHVTVRLAGRLALQGPGRRLRFGRGQAPSLRHRGRGRPHHCGRGGAHAHPTEGPGPLRARASRPARSPAQDRAVADIGRAAGHGAPPYVSHGA